MFAITERLLLRPGWAEDAPALARAIGDAAVVRNLAQAPWPYARGDAERFLALPADRLLPNFLVTLRDGGGIIGGIGLQQRDGAAELGYWIAHACWGRGYATEAGRAVAALADASLRLPRLVSSHATDNPASGRVLEKLGFAPIGFGTRYSVARRTDMSVRLFERDRPGVGALLAAA